MGVLQKFGWPNGIDLRLRTIVHLLIQSHVLLPNELRRPGVPQMHEGLRGHPGLRLRLQGQSQKALQLAHDLCVEPSASKVMKQGIKGFYLSGEPRLDPTEVS